LPVMDLPIIAMFVFGIAFSTGTSLREGCCNEKTVGGVKYRKIGTRNTTEFGCLQDCSYQKVDSSDETHYCFAEGNSTVVCEDDGGQFNATIERDLYFTENNETHIQKNSYNHEKREATLIVPAHGNNKAITVIMNAESGKMIVSDGKSCELEDIPKGIDPEHMKHSPVTTKRQQLQGETVKYHRVHSVRKHATSKELESLSESFKKECEGKVVIVVHSHEDVHHNNHIPDDFKNNSLKRVKGRSAENLENYNCNDVYYGCQRKTPVREDGICWRWSYAGFGVTPSASDTTGSGDPLIVTYHYNIAHQFCVKCCKDDVTSDSSLVPCSCINDDETGQAFSTAFKITTDLVANNLRDCEKHCILESDYCNWNGNEKLNNCPYNNGVCTGPSDANENNPCPVEDCRAQDCACWTPPSG